jgi:hypothetical protein
MLAKRWIWVFGIAFSIGGAACGDAEKDDDQYVGGASRVDGSVLGDASSAVADAGVGPLPTGSADGGSTAATVDGATGSSRPDASSAGADAGANRPPEAGATGGDDAEVSSDGGAVDAAAPLDAGDAGSDGGGGGPSCSLPTTFKWTGTAPLAQPKNGAVSMKDFTHAFHAGQHIVYFTTFQSNWGSGMMTFKDWADAAAAPQIKTGFGVAPTLFYFTPKSLWVLAYQWGPHKFSYRTSSDPSDANGWSGEKSLYNTALPPSGTGPIDQTVICDQAKCYLYYAGDNGHIYKSSMPIGSFPGEFPAAQDSGIVGTAQNLFEAVQVYKIKGTNQFLMIVEAQGSGRYFRAWTASSLDGPWTLLTNEFAIKKNVSFATNWTNDISHGDLVRTSPDETNTIDPCNLQLVFQGRDPNVNTDYGKLPYRLGLLTLQR